ncbi:hypothetical protein AALM51_14560 [Enterobacter roggenkampii]|uniref:hypothetical protein n=1 Tax=Enterobacter roggenkampii TaxID=1812935 RepID=UPI0035116E1A
MPTTVAITMIMVGRMLYTLHNEAKSGKQQKSNISEYTRGLMVSISALALANCDKTGELACSVIRGQSFPLCYLT